LTYLNFRICLERIRKVGETYKDRLRLMQELKPGSPEYETRVITTETRRSETSLLLWNLKSVPVW
jgi:hypothetical protein